MTAFLCSIDLAVWFHRAADLTDWLLSDQVSPGGIGRRGLASATVLQPGRPKLVCSSTQEMYFGRRRDDSAGGLDHLGEVELPAFDDVETRAFGVPDRPGRGSVGVRAGAVVRSVGWAPKGRVRTRSTRPCTGPPSSATPQIRDGHPTTDFVARPAYPDPGRRGWRTQPAGPR